MQLIKIIKKYYFYILYLPIILNFLINLIDKFSLDTLNALNVYDICSTLLLFFYLYFVGYLVKSSFNLPYISTGIIAYTFSFYIFENLIYLLSTKITFTQVFLTVNIFWLFYFLIIGRFKKEITILILSFLSLNFFNNLFFEKLSKNQNIIGDVKDIHLQHVQNIYNQNFYFSMHNPSLEGYSQLVAYFQALLNKLSLYVSDFQNFSSSINVLALLTLFFIFELDIDRELKFLLSTIYISLIGNSSWLKFLFVDSLMTEGSLSYLFCVLIVSARTSFDRNDKTQFISYFLLGILYLAKQFISTLALMSIFILFFSRKSRKYALAGFSGVLIKEVSYLTFFSSLTKNHHLKEVDLLDTIFDILYLRDLKISNITEILINLYLDKPILIVFLYLIAFGAFYFYQNGIKNQDIANYLIIIFSNFVLVFLLYITLWKNLELESPIRYMLNLLLLILITKFKIINSYKNLN